MRGWRAGRNFHASQDTALAARAQSTGLSERARSGRNYIESEIPRLARVPFRPATAVLKSK